MRHTGQTVLNLLREAARNSAGGLRVAPRVRRGRGPVRIALQAYSIHLAQMYRTVVSRLLERPDTEVTFILLPHPQLPRDTMSRLREFVHAELGLPRERVRPYHRILWEPFDLVLYNDVYARFPLARTVNCLLTHGPLLEARFLDPGPLHKSVMDFDVVGVTGERDYDRVRAVLRGRPSTPRVECVGFPFLDRLEHPPRDRAAWLAGLSLDPGATTILLAPHWKTLRPPGGAHRLEQSIAALARPGVNLVVKPHACSLVPAMAGGVDWRARLTALARDGVAIDFDPDDIPALAHADVLVTERSSRSVVFMGLGKPVVELVPDAPTLAESERLEIVGRGAHVARTAAELAELLSDPEGLAPRPEAAAVAAHCIGHGGRATDRLLEIVEESLPPRGAGRGIRAIGQRLDVSPRALGKPRDSSPVLDDTGALRERLAEDGYLYLRGFFDEREVLDARRPLAESLAERGLLDLARPAIECHAATRDRIPVEGEDGRFPGVRALLQGDRMLDLYRRLLGGEVRPYDFIWLRLMNPGQATGPHCDIVYMGRGTQHLYTSWVPLGSVPRSHGALLILEGSHRLAHRIEDYLHMDIDRERNWWKPRFRHGRLFRGGDYSRNPRAVQRQFGRRWLTTDYGPGDVIIFHAQTMHGSLDNTSETLRLSADCRYQLAAEPVDERWVGQKPIGHVRKE